MNKIELNEEVKTTELYFEKLGKVKIMEVLFEKLGRVEKCFFKRLYNSSVYDLDEGDIIIGFCDEDKHTDVGKIGIVTGTYYIDRDVFLANVCDYKEMHVYEQTGTLFWMDL